MRSTGAADDAGFEIRASWRPPGYGLHYAAMILAILDYLITFLLGVMLAVAGLLIMAGRDQPSDWALSYAPHLSVVVGVLGIRQVSRWVLAKRLPDHRLHLTGDARDG